MGNIKDVRSSLLTCLSLLSGNGKETSWSKKMLLY